eukprot:gene6063-biopygen8856
MGRRTRHVASRAVSLEPVPHPWVCSLVNPLPIPSGVRRAAPYQGLRKPRVLVHVPQVRLRDILRLLQGRPTERLRPAKEGGVRERSAEDTCRMRTQGAHAGRIQDASRGDAGRIEDPSVACPVRRSERPQAGWQITGPATLMLCFADEWANDHVKMKFAARKRRSLITMCRDFAACFNNEAVPPASVLQISLYRPRPVLVRRASAFLLPVLRRHELGAPRRATLRLCSAACRPSCSSAVCSGAGLCPGRSGQSLPCACVSVL